MGMYNLREWVDLGKSSVNNPQSRGPEALIPGLKIPHMAQSTSTRALRQERPHPNEKPSHLQRVIGSRCPQLEKAPERQQRPGVARNLKQANERF